MTTESRLNNPLHPCQFCAKPVPINQPYCDSACEHHDAIMRVFYVEIVEVVHITGGYENAS